MRVALVIGHTEKKFGAENKELGVTEFELNMAEAKRVKELLDEEDFGVASGIVFRDTYASLPKKINNLSPDFIISFHHNSFDETSTGTETLFYKTSTKGKTLAEVMQRNIVKALGYRDRGVKPKDIEDRGGYVLKYTDAPCVIVEPCFMSNTEELKNFIARQDEYCKGIVAGIKEFINS